MGDRAVAGAAEVGVGDEARAAVRAVRGGVQAGPGSAAQGGDEPDQQQGPVPGAGPGRARPAGRGYARLGLPPVWLTLGVCSSQAASAAL